MARSRRYKPLFLRSDFSQYQHLQQYFTNTKVLHNIAKTMCDNNSSTSSSGFKMTPLKGALFAATGPAGFFVYNKM